MKIHKSKIAVLVLNQSLIGAVFQIVRFPGNQKTTLTGESLNMVLFQKLYIFLELHTTNLQEAVKKVFLVCGIFNKKVFNNV